MGMAGELWFRVMDDNGKAGAWVDAYSTYGIFFTQNSLSKLMTPAPNKAAIENKTRTENGKQVIRKAKYAMKDERDIDLEMHLLASNVTDFFNKYKAFCTNVLDKGFFDIATTYTGYVNESNPGTVFHMTYLSCSQFSEFNRELAKFTLRLNEPNPGKRT